MGKAMGERGVLMNSGPSKTAEAIVAVFVPPACREEVLGDLHERYSSSGQYGLDAVRTIPLVIISRYAVRQTRKCSLCKLSLCTCRSWARLGSRIERF